MRPKRNGPTERTPTSPLSEAGRRPALRCWRVASRRHFVHNRSQGADARKSVPLILNLVTEGENTMSPIAHRTMPFSLLAAA